MTWYDQLDSLGAVDRLILDEVREGETIDYKRADHKYVDKHREQIAKHVCAFANSAGGVLVFGVDTKKGTDGTLPVARVPIDPANIERIQRAIYELVRHPVPGIRSKSLPVGGPPEVFLVDVPASPAAPHQQYRDKIYYRREGDSSKPMSHELVELYFGRRLGPVLEPTITTDVEQRSEDFGPRVTGKLTLRNVGAGVAHDGLLIVEPLLDSNVKLTVHGMGWHVLPRLARGNIQETRLLADALVIHPTDHMRVADIVVPGPPASSSGDVVVARLKVYAAHMRPSVWDVLLDVGVPTIYTLRVARTPESTVDER